MIRPIPALSAALLALPLLIGAARAECDVAGAGIEEAIAAKPSLRAEANTQTVRDLRTLRDAAIILEGYKHSEECRKIVALVRTLTAHPGKAIEASGDTDEEEAERVAESRKPKGTESKPGEAAAAKP